MHIWSQRKSWEGTLVPVYFQLNFKLHVKREQEIAFESMFNESRQTCCVADCIWEEKILQTYDCKWAMKQHEGICLPASIIKGQTAKERSLGIKCVSLLDINSAIFTSAKLSKWKPQFFEKSVLLKFTLPAKISWLIFLWFPGRNKKICRDQSRLTLLSGSFAAWFCAPDYTVHACTPIRVCAPTWSCSQAKQ